jgi:hypothetical protein
LARAARRILQNPARTEKPVRADHRLRTEDEAIRAQSTICNEPVFRILKNRVRCTDVVYPYTGRGWRAQRAGFCKTLHGRKSPSVRIIAYARMMNPSARNRRSLSKPVS